MTHLAWEAPQGNRPPGHVGGIQGGSAPLQATVGEGDLNPHDLAITGT